MGLDEGLNFKVFKKGGMVGRSLPMGLDSVGVVCLRSLTKASIVKIPMLGLGALILHVFILGWVGVVWLWGGRTALISKYSVRGCVWDGCLLLWDECGADI